MIKWEYQFIPQRNVVGTPAQLEDYFNVLGQEGWELCGIDYGCLIFKRPLKED